VKKGETKVPRLNHFSIIAEDPENLRQFYSRWFGFDELTRTADGAIFITDGYFSVGLLPRGSQSAEGAHEPGLHHAGFQIESIDDIEQRLREFDASMRISELPKGGYAEYRISDPEGLTIDLSEEGWGAQGQQRVPGIRHIATCNPKDPWRSFAFYSQVFGMKDARLTPDEVPVHAAMFQRAADTEIVDGSAAVGAVKRIKWDPATHSIVEVVEMQGPRTGGVPFACDGFVNMALLRTSDWIRPNLNHFGLLVRDAYGLMHRISEENPMRLDQRPQDRPFAEYRVWDPEGNAMDLSERKGFKVDVGKIERIED
jgi:catechol 2,3-dioxygenase-like lactoylglutathione lyase family enzyme